MDDAPPATDNNVVQPVFFYQVLDTTDGYLSEPGKCRRCHVSRHFLKRLNNKPCLSHYSNPPAFASSTMSERTIGSLSGRPAVLG